MIDSHCHLEMDAFDRDRDDVIRRAREAGLEAVITIGSDFEGCRGAVELSRRYDFVYAAVGIHPHDAKDFNDDIFRQIREWTTGNDAGCTEDAGPPPKVVALGEIGLDYHYDHSPREVQREVFARQLAYAVENGLAVVIHSREARDDTLAIVEQSGVTRGVMHCYSGDPDMAKRLMDRGLLISIAGPVTYKNASRLRDLVKMIPDDFLLIETDAPYLTPDPLRGKRNEPAYIVHTARRIAELRGISPDDLDRITTLNAKKLFGIGGMPESEIAYQIRDSLYLNVTNRCTNACGFCVRFYSDYVKGHNLRLRRDPSADELIAAIGDPGRYRQVVFCGLGEPLLRLETVKEVAAWIKSRGGAVRINTNGHGAVIHKRNILPELQGLVDAVSVSLNAQDAETYNRICKPAFTGAYDEVLRFIREAKVYIPDVQATVVDADGVDVGACRRIADNLGVPLRVRSLDVVG
ncbi:MAG TPA: TatD family hydrolase [Dissulfurispiraceae bacterium]|nr:TatD family hydrolase [Dissulfurispiraceae bacterium]